MLFPALFFASFFLFLLFPDEVLNDHIAIFVFPTNQSGWKMMCTPAATGD